MHFASCPCTFLLFAVGFAAYSEMLPQSATVAFILEKIAANGNVMGVSFDRGVVAGQVLNVVSFFLGQLHVVHGNLSCRKGRMLLHTELFRYGKFALQILICWPLFIII